MQDLIYGNAKQLLTPSRGTAARPRGACMVPGWALLPLLLLLLLPQQAGADALLGGASPFAPALGSGGAVLAVALFGLQGGAISA